ncbi:MAG TPA: multicopper oxidase domain-containing protein [Propionibacteriaceae bacterium]|nr:multicopper oxidase domain-containing protein [Propionibacteriaceae bacterium]
MQLSRRDMLKLGGLGAVGAAGLTLPFRSDVSASSASLLPDSKMPVVFRNPFIRQEVLQPYKKGVDAQGQPMHFYDITAKTGTANIVPGLPTPILGYAGRVPGPRIDVDQGTKIVMQIRNQLPATHPTFGTPVKISTHLHGSASLPQYDGYASDVTPSGQKKYYHYPNFQGARTLWYHDHGVHYTAQNAYSGLAAQYHMHDRAERALLPQGEFDVALTLSDIAFKANASQLYDDRSQSGLWGDVILVNGVPWPVMKVKRRIYRFRVLNASISRSYRPTTSPAAPTYVVAMDGGLAPKTQQISSWRHGNAERYEVLIDFRSFKPGTKINLNNLSNPNNRDFDHTNKIMQFQVVDEGVLPPDEDRALTSIPNNLVNSDVMALTPTSSMKIRNLKLERSNGLWAVNGETWDDIVKSGYKRVLANPALGDTEVWNIQNNSGGWFHPLHIHLVDFKVLSRNGRAPFAYEQGPKDTVYVGENESVKLIMKFGDKNGPVKNTGKYMVHCHNLVHEDHDMMHQFSVGLNDTDTDANDPIHAAPCVGDGDDDQKPEAW